MSMILLAFVPAGLYAFLDSTRRRVASAGRPRLTSMIPSATLFGFTWMLFLSTWNGERDMAMLYGGIAGSSYLVMSYVFAWLQQFTTRNHMMAQVNKPTQRR